MPASVTDILLASDLSPRCDRALARAFALAAGWNARVHVVTAIEADQHLLHLGTDASARAADEVAALVGTTAVAWEAHVRTGLPHVAIKAAATELGCQLIVTGVATNEFMGRARPGRTVDALVRRGEIPLLMVKKPALRPYRRILVPSDFSGASEAALSLAAALFPEAAFTLLHTYAVPFAGFLGAAGSEPQIHEAAATEQAAFIDRFRDRSGFSGALFGILERGSPEDAVAAHTHGDRPDLTVIGINASGGLDRHFGDLGGRLMVAADSDVLAVPH